MGGDRKHVTICSTNDSFNRALRLLLDDVDVTVGSHPQEIDANSDLLLWRLDEGWPEGQMTEVASSKPTLVLAPPDRLMDAVDAGCVGFLANDAPLDEIRDAAATVLNGGSVVSPELLGQLLQRLVQRRKAEAQAQAPLDSLTDREREVFRLAAEGLRKEEIGERLFISPATARTHLQRVYRKLGIHSQAELMALNTNGERHRRQT